MADMAAGCELRIVNLSKALDDLKGIKSQESTKINDLENKIVRLGQSESRLKCMVVDMEKEIRTDDLQCSDLAREIIEREMNYESEKNEFEAVFEQANRKIDLLSRELETISLHQMKEKNDKIVALQNSLVALQNQHELKIRQNKKRTEEVDRDRADLARNLSEMKLNVTKLNEELEEITGSNDQERIEKTELEKRVCQCQHIILHKNEVIKGLELTIQSARDTLMKKNDFDLVIDKIRELKTENRNIKLDNHKYDQDNNRLGQENAVLKNDFRKEDGDMVLLNRNLTQENRKLQERIANQVAYQELFEAAQKELRMLKVKSEIETDGLAAHIGELEREKHTNASKLVSLESAKIEKIKTISNLKLHTSY